MADVFHYFFVLLFCLEKILKFQNQFLVLLRMLPNLVLGMYFPDIILQRPYPMHVHDFIQQLGILSIAKDVHIF